VRVQKCGNVLRAETIGFLTHTCVTKFTKLEIIFDFISTKL